MLLDHFVVHFVTVIYKIKEFVQPKMSLNNRKCLIWKERGGGQVGQQAGIFKVRFGTDRGEIQRDREI